MHGGKSVIVPSVSHADALALLSLSGNNHDYERKLHLDNVKHCQSSVLKYQSGSNKATLTSILFRGAGKFVALSLYIHSCITRVVGRLLSHTVILIQENETMSAKVCN